MSPTRRVVGVSAMAASALLALGLTAGPAAALGTGTSVPGAWGKIENVQWQNGHFVYLHFYLEDTAADGDHAQARAWSTDDSGHTTTYAWHSAVGKGHVYEANTHISDTAGVRSIRIQVCRMGDDLPDVCDWSTELENPYHTS